GDHAPGINACAVVREGEPAGHLEEPLLIGLVDVLAVGHEGPNTKSPTCTFGLNPPQTPKLTIPVTSGGNSVCKLSRAWAPHRLTTLPDVGPMILASSCRPVKTPIMIPPHTPGIRPSADPGNYTCGSGDGILSKGSHLVSCQRSKGPEK